jgi:ketosteroid isomerase-like protein
MAPQRAGILDSARMGAVRRHHDWKGENMTPTRILSVLLVACIAGMTLGCAPRQIPNSTVEASDANLAVWAVVQAYRRALEERDTDALLAIVSPDYFDNNSTTDVGSDDYGYRVVQERMLPILSDNIEKVRIDLRLREVRVSGDRAFARFEQRIRFLFSEGGQDGWETLNDFNELAFSWEGDGWRIVSGL